MSDQIDVRTVGWNNPDCCSRHWVDTSYNDDDGYYHTDGEWSDQLLCDTTTVDAKHDYCKRCNKTLVYP